jgi:hypothetical protein
MSGLLETRPRRIGLIVLAFLVGLFALCGGLWYFSCRSDPNHPVTVKEFEQWVDAAVPSGTPKKVVVAWLHAQRIIVDEDPPHVERGNVIRGLTASHNRMLCDEYWGTGKVTLTFIFDDKDRLTQRIVGIEQESL